MNNQINEEVFAELVSSSKAGSTNRLPSVDRAIVWASEEIERLRALVAAQAPVKVTDTTEVKTPGLDWNAFQDSDDEDFNLGNTTPVAAPSACSLENPSCESCQ
jgi:hypothetical protein